MVDSPLNEVWRNLVVMIMSRVYRISSQKRLDNTKNKPQTTQIKLETTQTYG